MADLFIADMHLNHPNILSYDNRPFVSIEEHDETIRRNWKSNVKTTDDVYICGDVCFGDAKTAVRLLKDLPGRKHLLIGNHDKKLIKDKEFRALFVEIKDYIELKLDNNKIIVLSHYPIPCFNKHYYGSYHLYGHVHDSFEAKMMEHIKLEMEQLYTVPCNMFNVGVMMPHMNYTPRTLEHIINNYGKAC